MEDTYGIFTPDIKMEIKYDYKGNTFNHTKYWGYLDYTIDETIERIGKEYYNTICRNMENVELYLYYNEKLIWTNVK